MLRLLWARWDLGALPWAGWDRDLLICSPPEGGGGTMGEVGMPALAPCQLLAPAAGCGAYEPAGSCHRCQYGLLEHVIVPEQL